MSLTMELSDKFLYVSDMKLWNPAFSARLIWGDVFVCQRDWSWRTGSLPNPDIWYVIEGTGWIDVDGQRTAIAAGDCLVMRKGRGYRAGHDPERPLTFIAVHFRLLDAASGPLELEPGEYPPFVRQMEMGSLVRELLHRAVQGYRDGCLEWAHAWLQAALMEVVRQDAQTFPPGPLGDQMRAIVDDCRRIRRNLMHPPRVEELAAELHLSPEHFSRLFRRFQGIPPRTFITRTRIEAAQNLLLKSSHSVARISELVGYESPFYFSRQFKAKVGLSPRAFRHGGRRPAERTGD